MDRKSRRQKQIDDAQEVQDELDKIEEEMKKLKKRKKVLSARREQLLCEPMVEDLNDIQFREKFENESFPWDNEALKCLRETFKLQEFRSLQKAVINAVLSKEDVIVVMNTGGGKSLCYQLPAMMMSGLTLVISPLVSLIEDQIANLNRLGIDGAFCLTQTSDSNSVLTAISLRFSGVKMLYVTPEKLAKSKTVMNKLEKSLKHGYLKLIAIDEVHCCSQWGHDFRKDYAFLNVLKRQFKGVPIMGLTATATENVLTDVKDMLGLQSSIVFRAGFNRPNLDYEVLHRPSADNAMEIAEIIEKRFKNQSGIIYCFSRKDCEKMAEKLRELGLGAEPYHAYLDREIKTKAHERWCSGETQVIVATVAFGMGIDKPDVRFVIHHSIPKSIENFYQESGRAGRDGLQSVCILFYRLADFFRISTMVYVDCKGTINFYNMVRYAMEQKECRREVLASHFEVEYDPTWCDKACDNCRKDQGLPTPIDVTYILKAAVKIIEQQKSEQGSGRVTGGKLCDLVIKSLKELKNRKEYTEHVITELILREYLEESFHFTPYSVISYIEPGPKWSENAVVTLELIDKPTVVETTRKRKLTK